MATNIAEFTNLFITSDRKIFVGEKSTLSVQTFSCDNSCEFTSSP